MQFLFGYDLFFLRDYNLLPKKGATFEPLGTFWGRALGLSAWTLISRLSGPEGARNQSSTCIRGLSLSLSPPLSPSIYIYICIYTYICILHVIMCVYTHVCVNIYIYMYGYIYICIYIYVYVCMCIYIYINI